MARQFPPANLDPVAGRWIRDIEGRIGSMEDDLGRRKNNDETENKTQNSQLANLGSAVRGLNDLVVALPLLASGQTSSTGFALSAGWASYAALVIPVPEGKKLATILAVGGAAVLDRTTAGATSSNARIVIDGNSSSTFPAAKDAGASMVNNVLSPSFGLSINDPSGVIAVSLDIQPLNSSAFGASVSNFASLTVIAVFS